MSTSHVLVIGAGWAGLTAAIRLTQAGYKVTLIDSAPQPGGRARTQTLNLAGHTITVDNGQHLLMGAYTATLALLNAIGVVPATVLERSRLALRSHDGLHLRALPGPSPWHLLGGLLLARGLNLSERLALARAMLPLRQHGIKSIAPGASVQHWLQATNQPASLIQRIWQPLCLGALNTRITEACATTFARVLMDTLLSNARAADFLLPRSTLGAVLPEPALAWLRQRHVHVALRTPCRALRRNVNGVWQAQTDRGTFSAPQVILAVPPRQVVRLLDTQPMASTTRHALNALDYAAITTVWLAWRHMVSLPQVILLTEDAVQAAPGQWLFGRSALDAGPWRAVAGVVISDSDAYTATPAEFAHRVAQQVQRQASLPAPDAARAIIERQATIRCTPTRPNLTPDALWPDTPGICLAGDWLWPDYPATLESAVRSGSAAAATLHQHVTRIRQG